MPVRPLFLVSNDDGVYAEGILALSEAASEFGEVIVSAPAQEQSGMSQALTLRTNLRVHEVGPKRFAVTGTPADSVYLGLLHLCPRPPDLVLSGINHGYNLGSDVYYSGTVGAAREGYMQGCSALAVSVQRGADPKIAQDYVRRVIPKILEAQSAQKRVLLNMNVPQTRNDDSLCLTRLGTRRYQEQVAPRVDLNGQEYFWIGGPPLDSDDGPGFDTHEVARGRASLTQLGLEVVAPHAEHWAAAFDSI